MKKLISALLAAVMVFSLSIASFAAVSKYYPQTYYGINKFNTWKVTSLNSVFLPSLATYSAGGQTLTSNSPLASSSSNNALINASGCGACSAAMVLNNLGASTKAVRTDFRSTLVSRLSADPFVVTMENIGYPTITLNSNTKKYEIKGQTESPVYMYWDVVAKAFGKTASKTTLSGTAEQRAATLTNLIKANPQGVIACLGGWHWVVFTGSTYASTKSIDTNIVLTEVTPSMAKQMVNENKIAAANFIPKEQSAVSSRSSTLDSKFTVYDPWSTTQYSGNGVLLSNTWSATQSLGIDRIGSIIIIK